jgi:hypothetical protein
MGDGGFCLCDWFWHSLSPTNKPEAVVLHFNVIVDMKCKSSRVVLSHQRGYEKQTSKVVAAVLLLLCVPIYFG